MNELRCPTHRFEIFIAGNYALAEQVCRQYCMSASYCVTVEPTEYVYKGGQEAGVRVGLINYPRFPEDVETTLERARELAERLRAELCQTSYTITGPAESIFVSYRQGT